MEISETMIRGICAALNKFVFFFNKYFNKKPQLYFGFKPSLLDISPELIEK